MKALLIIMFFAPIILNGQNSSEHEVDSLKQVIKSAKHDTTIINAWLSWDGIIYLEDPDLDLKLNQKIDRLCLENLNKKLDPKVRTKFLQSRAYALNNLGIIYDSKGDYATAIDNYTYSLKTYEEIGDQKGIAISLNNIGAIYHEQGNYDKAIDYYSKSLKIKEDLEDKRGIALSLSNIGNIYQTKSENEKAIEFYEKSLLIREEIDDQKGIASSLNNIGIIHQNRAKYTKAMDCLKKSLEISEQIGDQKGMAHYLSNIGNVYKSLNNFPKAHEYNKQALRIAQEIGAAMEIKQAAVALWEINKKLDRHKESLSMYELFIDTRDSLESLENQKEVVRQEYKYQYEKQAAADSLINAETEKVQAAKLEAEHALSEQRKTEIIAQKKQSVFLFIGLGLIALFSFFMYNRFRVTKKQKLIMESQKKEVEKQKEIAERALKELEITHLKLEVTHEQLTDSINYSERIQKAILPPNDQVKEILPNSFIFYKPRDIVSGDFYFVEHIKREDEKPLAFVAAVDCTGHGVPGAFMSLIGSSYLKQSLNEPDIQSPAEVLMFLNSGVHETLRINDDKDIKDGMDMALCVLDLENKSLDFAGAKNPIFIVTEIEEGDDISSGGRDTIYNDQLGKKLIHIKGDIHPIGVHVSTELFPFTNHTYDLKAGDTIYMFSDGFADQFGGPNGKKYGNKAFKSFLIELSENVIDSQEKIIRQEFNNWKSANNKELEQIDDVLVIGIKIE